MPKAKKNELHKNKRAVDSRIASSLLDKEWPPAWSVSFADMTTLLMTAFVLIYALTAKKIPQELLALKEGQRITPEVIEYLEKWKNMEVSPEAMLSMIKNITPEQELAIEEVKRIKELEMELKKYFKSMQLEDVVETQAEIEAVLVRLRSPLLFQEGEAKLKPEGIKLLERIAQLLQGIPYYQVRIEGYTDTKPIDPFHRHMYDSNWELSYARAVSIAKYLMSKGIFPERIGAVGYGPEKPVAPNDTPENRTKNRRVEIYISFAKPSKEK